ncbi:MAG: class I SAM-dependent methyltransferase [Flavobacteriaceae bacterium]
MKPISVKDHSVSKESFHIVFDSGVGAWKTTPQPSEQELKAYYPKEGYLSHTDKAQGLKDRLYLWAKNKNIQTKLRWITVKSNRPKLLDFGAGNGAFALAAQAKGWHVCTQEFSDNALLSLKAKGLKVIDVSQQKGAFDAITLWHVFEHLPNPKAQLASFYNALTPGGIVALALPNIDAWDARHYGAQWAAYDVPRHLWHYNKTAIAQLAKDAGFQLVKTHNMFWDAFYISLLSEQYRQSKCAWINATIKGSLSNFLGWRKKNTSALTFILQKPK